MPGNFIFNLRSTSLVRFSTEIEFRIFLCRVAVEPLYPQVCQKLPVLVPTTEDQGISPVDLSRALNSVACSLSVKREDPVAIFHLIMEVRRNTPAGWCNSFIFSYIYTYRLVITWRIYGTACNSGCVARSPSPSRRRYRHSCYCRRSSLSIKYSGYAASSSPFCRHPWSPRRLIRQ